MKRSNSILAACISCVLALVSVSARSPSLRPGSADAVTRSEGKKLAKTFGLVLPASAKVTSRLKTPQSKVIYLLIEMSADDSQLFKQRLGTGPSPGHPNIQPAVEYKDCVKKEGFSCTSIGALNVPRDLPEAIINKWYEDNEFQTDTIASYSTRGFKKFASMFMDSKKGLLLLWYKA